MIAVARGAAVMVAAAMCVAFAQTGRQAPPTVVEASITDMRTAMEQGRVTSRQSSASRYRSSAPSLRPYTSCSPAFSASSSSGQSRLESTADSSIERSPP